VRIAYHPDTDWSIPLMLWFAVAGAGAWAVFALIGYAVWLVL
jgi:hypothetical protein